MQELARTNYQEQRLIVCLHHRTLVHPPPPLIASHPPVASTSICKITRCTCLNHHRRHIRAESVRQCHHLYWIRLLKSLCLCGHIQAAASGCRCRIWAICEDGGREGTWVERFIANGRGKRWVEGGERRTRQDERKEDESILFLVFFFNHAWVRREAKDKTARYRCFSMYGVEIGFFFLGQSLHPCSEIVF